MLSDERIFGSGVTFREILHSGREGTLLDGDFAARVNAVHARARTHNHCPCLAHAGCLGSKVVVGLMLVKLRGLFSKWEVYIPNDFEWAVPAGSLPAPFDSCWLNSVFGGFALCRLPMVQSCYARDIYACLVVRLVERRTRAYRASPVWEVSTSAGARSSSAALAGW